MSIIPMGSRGMRGGVCSSRSEEKSSSSSTSTSASSAWEAICPELFALILKAVQEKAREDPSEARRVVALAGVCRRWRHLVQQSYSSPRGLLQFPFSLIRSSAGHVRCLLKRAGPGLFVLFQENSPGPKLDFLMAACRKPWRPACASFSISASPRCFSKHDHAYMGKLTSDLWGQEFCLWEACGHDPSAKRPAARIRFWDERAEGSPFMQRRMACEVFNVAVGKKGSRRASQAVVPEQRQASSHSAAHGWQKWACFLDPSSSSSSSSATVIRPAPAAKKTFLRSYSSLRRNSGQLLERNRSCRRSRELAPNPNSFLMESKTPEWDEHRGCWSLDFHGRASLPSHHSFQLVRKRAPPNPSSTVDANRPINDHNTSSALPQDAEEQETVFLQLGKVGKGLYTMDFCYPLSAFQAFSISLSSFATKVGVEP